MRTMGVMRQTILSGLKTGPRVALSRHSETPIAPATPPPNMQHMGNAFTSPSAAEVANPQAVDMHRHSDTSGPPMGGTQGAPSASNLPGGEDPPDYTTKAVLSKFHKTAQFNHLTHKDDPLVTQETGAYRVTQHSCTDCTEIRHPQKKTAF